MYVAFELPAPFAGSQEKNLLPIKQDFLCDNFTTLQFYNFDNCDLTYN